MQAMKTQMRLFRIMMDKLYEVGWVGDICCFFLLKTPSSCSYTRCSQYTIDGEGTLLSH